MRINKINMKQNPWNKAKQNKKKKKQRKKQEAIFENKQTWNKTCEIEPK
jgi:hypothetical protein